MVSNENANERLNELKKIIREEEYIYYGNMSFFKYLTYLSYSIFALFALSILANDITQISLQDWLITGILVSFVIMGLRLLKHFMTKERFSTRINPAGIMLTHHGQRTWHSWNEISNVEIRGNTDSKLTDVYLEVKGHLGKLKWNLKFDGSKKIPRNYDVYQQELLEDIQRMRALFKELKLDKHPDIIQYAGEDPPIKYGFSWGRHAASEQKSLTSQIKQYWDEQ